MNLAMAPPDAEVGPIRSQEFTVHGPTLRRLSPRTLGLALTLAVAAPLAHAGPQSTTASQASEASVMASVQVPVTVASALAAGASLVVTSVAASGGVVVLTVSVLGVAGATFLLTLTAEAFARLGISDGTMLTVVTVSGGWILLKGGEAIAFLADTATQPLFHSDEVRR